MIYNYKELKDKLGSDYQINKKINNRELYKITEGIYSDKELINPMTLVCKKYSKAIITMDSAFYYHDLTDVIPEKYHLITDRGAPKISDKRVVQLFENSDILYLGAEHFEDNGYKFLMYNKERMLLELLRNKNKLPFDYYKEIIGNYRKIIHELDIQQIQDMLLVMPKSRMIMQLLELEVL